jgi:peptidoglycan/xylan/chitin deacetylase (PgdA/CDA1 family)
MGKPALFTTSWDDGHPLDLRVAELLRKHQLKGTFYVPGRMPPGGCYGPEGFEVLSKSDLRQLGAEFEVGSHTLDHKRLDNLPDQEARHQILAGKQFLEDQLGQSVNGFCYPNGFHTARTRQLVRDCGISYARTTEDLYDNVGDDPYQMPVSLHFYPRPRAYVVRSFVSQEKRRLGSWRWPRRLNMLAAAASKDEFEGRVRVLIDRICNRGGVLHLWGHSWEVERIGGWKLLDSVFRYAAERLPSSARVTNGALFSGAMAAR